MAAGAPYRFEQAAWRRGLTRVAGVDEAGRGPLAGPVVAAAVILPPDGRIEGVDDSKRLAAEERERLYALILSRAAVAVGMADPATIDRVNILEATRLAMRQALAALPAAPELVLTDYVALDGLGCPQKNLVQGDRRSATVAAASVVAKVTRDRLMQAADREYPEYGFGRHKGYPTPEHRAALLKHGPCPLHRRSFTGVFQIPLPFGERAG